MSSSNKRERELARAKYERQQQRRAERAAAHKRRNQIVAVVAALAVVVVGVGVVLWSSRDDGSDVAAEGSGSPTASASATPSDSASPSASDSASPSSSAAACESPVTPTTKTQTWPAAPTGTLAKAATITLETNCGDIVIETVEPAKAPQTTASMTFLTSQKFYDASDCFRLTTAGIFVLQCGSPNNDGTGGPGYTVPDENLPAAGTNNYPKGTVAMANAGPGTAGSQFFLVYADTTLGPDYTIWGTVVSGMDVLEKVAAAGVSGGGSDGKPNQSIVITKATTDETPAG